MDRLKAIEQALVQGHIERVAEETRLALEENTPPRTILDQALVPAMDEVGRLFQNFEYFLPELLVSAKAMHGALDLLEPLLVQGDGGRGRGVVILGTVAGDRHDIGKNLVGMMLQGAGFTVHDLGTDVSPEAFVQAVKDHQPHVVGLSSMLTTTMPSMGRTIEALHQAQLVDVAVIVGGASVTEDYQQQIGAQGYAPDATAAVELVRRLTAP